MVIVKLSIYSGGRITMAINTLVWSIRSLSAEQVDSEWFTYEWAPVEFMCIFLEFGTSAAH